MHEGMQYDPIQGQGQGHEPLKVGNSAIFKGYLLPHFRLSRKEGEGANRHLRPTLLGRLGGVDLKRRQEPQVFYNGG